MATSEDTYFKIYRKIFDNSIWSNLLEFRLFLWIVGHAIFDKPKNYDEVQVCRGQYLRSYRKLSADLEYIENNVTVRYSPKTIQRAAIKLVKKGVILTQDTKLATLFTVVNYDKYQPKQTKNEDYQGREEKANKGLATGHDTSLPQAGHNIKNVKNVKEYKFSPNSEEFRLSSLLLSLIKTRRLEFRDPNLQAWCKHLERLIKLDKRAPEEIEKVIRWSQTNIFWQNNILSTDKLRQQYDKLALQMDSELKQKSASKPIKQLSQTLTSEGERIFTL